MKKNHFTTIISVILLCNLFVSCNLTGRSMVNQENFSKGLYFENKTFKDTLNFTQLQSRILGKRVGEAIEENLTFVNCVFEAPVLAYVKKGLRNETLVHFKGKVSFINCVFKDEVNFRGSSFLGDMIMTDAIFLKKVNFQDAIFMQKVNFYNSKFAEDLAFQNARFYHRSSFMEVKISGNASFQSCVFHDDVNFAVSIAFQYMDFSLCRFYGYAIFDYIDWQGRTVFNNSTFFMRVQFLQAKFGEISMENIDKRGVFKYQPVED